MRYRHAVFALVTATVVVACGSASTPGAVASLCENGCPPDRDASVGSDVGESEASLLGEASTEDACIPPPTTTDLPVDDCTILSATCPTCAEGVAYRCKSRGQPKVPIVVAKDGRLQGCRRAAYDPMTGFTDYCCPPACIRSSSMDDGCTKPNPTGFSCATNAEGKSVTGPPPGNCYPFVSTFPGAAVEWYCCE